MKHRSQPPGPLDLVSPRGHYGMVSTAVVVGIVVLLMLLGIGIVVNQLFRMKDWLKNSPPPEPPED